MTPIVATAILSAVSDFWIAARLAFDRFRNEKVWERRAEAYTAIFDSLHDIERWAIQRRTGEILGGDVRDLEFGHYKDAVTAMMRRLARESWLLSDQFRLRIKLYMETDLRPKDRLSFLIPYMTTPRNWPPIFARLRGRTLSDEPHHTNSLGR